MNGITIRPARAADYDRLTQVWIEGRVPLTGESDAVPPGLLDELRARIPREVASGGWSLFAGERDGRIVGMLAIILAERQLDQIFVAKAARSQGTGKALLDFAKTRMPDGFWLRTHTRNVPGHKFYEREGLIHRRDAPHPRHPEEMFRIYEWVCPG
ncbi:MAG TPA: GNAT family N-acetyltransferase [Rhizomicrobium sp.]|jgi:GNAT superfamily N-acetyltransferase|nr:GNAT family N-acetyltransferase [Rhizomicrobium sp.]